MANLSYSRTNRKCSNFATKHFQGKSLKIFDLHPPLRRLVLFVTQIITWKVRCWVTDTHTDTHAHTDTQTKYCNPRCACVPRVNKCRTPTSSENRRVFACCVWVKASHLFFWLNSDHPRSSIAFSFLSRVMMSANRSGLASFLLNIRKGAYPRVLLSFLALQ